MTITIVCCCGHHNTVGEDELDSARCRHCLRLLLATEATPPVALPPPVAARTAR